MKIDFLKIKAGFLSPKGKKQGFDSYVSSMEQLVKEMIPKDLFKSEVEPPYFLSYESYFQKLDQSLPLLKWSSLEEAPCNLSIAVLCAAEFTHGTGRFFCDTIARNLIPGKQIAIPVIRSLNFRFIIHPAQHYFITELYLNIENERDLHQIRKILPSLAQEIRLTLLATQHARKLVLSKPLTLDEKSMILLENLSCLIKRPENKLNHSILEDTHNLLLKVTHEKKPTQIPSHLLSLIEEKPRAVDPNMFQGIQSLILMFGENMISKRDIRHLYRTLSYLYLFRKIMSHRLKTMGNDHLVSVKILRTSIQSKTPILAILICIHFRNENEVLDKQLLTQTIQSYLPCSYLVENSFITCPKDKERLSTIYLEMAREGDQSFPQSALKDLKKKLPKQIHNLIRSSPDKHLTDHNEEEIMRNILTLTKHLKSPQDPQPVIIHFSKETLDTVTFTVILVSLQSSKLEFHHKPHLQVLSHQTKIAGILQKRYLQNAHILELKLEKKPFIQKDHVFSLYEARKFILSFLKEHFGSVRDFNSGMIVKQYENLSKLKTLALPSELVEKYFYSLRPGYMQSLLSIETLHLLFEMLVKSLKISFQETSYYFTSQISKEELLIMISSMSDELIDKIKQEIASLISLSTDLTMSDVSTKNTRALGLIFSVEDPALRQKFLTQITSFIKSLDPCLISTL